MIRGFDASFWDQPFRTKVLSPVSDCGWGRGWHDDIELFVMNPRLRLVFALPLLAFAALGVWSLGTKPVRLLLGGVRGVGVVERIEVISTSTRTKRDAYGNSQSDASHATFLHLSVTTADGGVVPAKTRVTFNTPAHVGDRFPVIYLPSAPERAQIMTGRQFWLPLVVGSVVTLGCAVAGGWLAWSWRQATGKLEGGRTWRPATRIPETGRFVPASRPGADTLAGRWASPKARKIFGHVAAHGIGFLGCVGLPVLFTWAAPVGRIELSRDGGTVTAQMRTCLLLVVPFREATVSPVTSVGHRVKTGSMTRTSRTGRHEYHKSEDQGFLELKGPNGSAEMPVTPHNLTDVESQIVDFLNDPSEERLRLFVVANWKFSVLGGGLVSLMTLLYAGGVVATLGSWMWRLLVPRTAPNGVDEVTHGRRARVSATGN